jgi:TonB system transport protein ExbD (group 1)
MAMHLGGGLGGGHKQDYPDNSEINVTPFVDIMLVLLIIFMVAAPLATVDVKVELPRSTAKPDTGIKDPIYISLKKTGKIFVGNNETTLASLGPVLVERSLGNREVRLLIRADKEVKYKEVMRIMNTLQDNGFFKAGLVGEDIVSKGKPLP